MTTPYPEDDFSRDSGFAYEDSRDSLYFQCMTTEITTSETISIESDSTDPIDIDIYQNNSTANTKKNYSKGLTDVTNNYNNLQNCIHLSNKTDLKTFSCQVNRKRAFETSFINDDSIPRRKRIDISFENDTSFNESPKARISKTKSTSFIPKRKAAFSAFTSSLSIGCLSEAHTSENYYNEDFVYSLPLVERPQKPSSAYGSISGETLVNLMTKLGNDFQEKYILIDCRYPYEYEGGHVSGAMNFYTPEKIDNMFFPEDECLAKCIKNKVPIFYCEFSQKRGPGMADALRAADRIRNRYPTVSYREIYVLDRGYKKFFTEDKFFDYCNPVSYIPMLHPDYNSELEKYKHIHKSKTGKDRRERSIKLRTVRSSGTKRVLQFNTEREKKLEMLLEIPSLPSSNTISDIFSEDSNFSQDINSYCSDK
ncbi:M-phase inducer phosphatase family and Rhodanese-like domain-containing protein [Strongyloides ratti]|uniref:protein-tyrosine-phosphatase n=1 Tax=Strongyloides ratti TaxID=34506 RepID=A0A090L218_STRRB|nr:M-phase inducer phosphatase family and Rhodanese-like domain-containing protein [Strongyloides ratti]CEF63707.1 M-phase inducer phosphatase family and Rhodanese-like domain-containing protein [Strongyloides ratti]